jgi:pimeloyl-ACP methyl ester carboxylesterase
MMLAFLFSNRLFAASETLVKVESRPGVEQRFIFIQPDRPVAAVILFEGDHGGLGLFAASGKPVMGWGKQGFLARSRQAFAAHGLTVAVIDSPSDKKEMDAIWRMSPEHADDIAAVIGAVKKESAAPVWVVGMSMGSFSAPNAAIRLAGDIDGLVLVSSVTRSREKWDIRDSYPNGIINMNLEKIMVPALIVSHKEDGCEITPASDAEKLKNALKNSPKVEIATFTGGKKPKSKPCQALSAHGYFGIEEPVVTAIAGFIKTNSKGN